MKRAGIFTLLTLVVLACPWDTSLREYLSRKFWQPFAKHPARFEKPGVHRISEPFAGMEPGKGDSPLAALREAYQDIASPRTQPFDVEPFRRAVEAARAMASLTAREKEEIELIDAKIDLRAGRPDEPALLESAKRKFEKFLLTARTPAFRSEARGWLARVHFLLGDQTAAGKMYLDELNRPGSNLSRETLLNSLAMTYGFDGGPQLREHLAEYFDTPEHALFAVQLATNPRAHLPEDAPPGGAVTALLEQHKALLKSGEVTLLAMRTALYEGDPAAALRLAAAAPAQAPVRSEPDFLWMLGSAHFLTRDYANAEGPLVDLFRSARAQPNQKAAAAYGLCGVYWKTGNQLERLRYALWLRDRAGSREPGLGGIARLSDLTVYWADSGWDLNLMLEFETPLETLRTFIEQNPKTPGLRIVQYALAVRLAREGRYEESATVYASIGAAPRAARMRRIGALQAAATDNAGKYALADFLSAHSERVFFNDSLWWGMQRYAFGAEEDGRLTRAERDTLVVGERKLKDDQEERWQAYLILKDVVATEGRTDLGRQAAALAVRCLRNIRTDRFGREAEIRAADVQLSRWLAGK